MTKLPSQAKTSSFYLLLETACSGNGAYAFDLYSRMVLRDLFATSLSDQELINILYHLAKYPLTKPVAELTTGIIEEAVSTKRFEPLMAHLK